MVELNKRDIESRINRLLNEGELTLEESTYLKTLQTAREALNSATKENIDLSVDEAKTKLAIGTYALNELIK